MRGFVIEKAYMCLYAAALTGLGCFVTTGFTFGFG